MTGLPSADADRSVAAWPARWSAWKVPLLRAVLAWWAGTWLPLVLGPLGDCGHCVQIYLLTLPVQPGVIFAVMLSCSGFEFGLVAGIATIALVAGSASLMRGPRWALLAIPICVAQTAFAFGLAAMLRM
jgi:hypothetical protein